MIDPNYRAKRCPNCGWKSCIDVLEYVYCPMCRTELELYDFREDLAKARALGMKMDKRKAAIAGAISGALAGVLGAWIGNTTGFHPALIGISAVCIALAAVITWRLLRK